MDAYGEVSTSVVTRPSPAAGGGFTYAPPEAVRFKVAAVSFQLVTAVAVATRLVSLDLLDGASNIIGRFSAGFTQSASKTSVYTFAAGINEYGANDAAAIGAPLPDLWLPDGSSIAVNVGAVQAADQVSAVVVTLRQYGIRPDSQSS